MGSVKASWSTVAWGALLLASLTQLLHAQEPPSSLGAGTGAEAGSEAVEPSAALEGSGDEPARCIAQANTAAPAALEGQECSTEHMEIEEGWCRHSGEGLLPSAEEKRAADPPSTPPRQLAPSPTPSTKSKPRSARSERLGPAPSQHTAPRTSDDPPPERLATGTLVFLASLLGVMLLLLPLIRGRLAPQGWLPMLLAACDWTMRFALLALLLWLAARLCPEPLVAYLPWALGALAVGGGWAAARFLPDFWAGVWLRLGRRLRPGAWVSGEGFVGLIDEVGWTATRLSGNAGSASWVPNRYLLSRVVEFRKAFRSTHRFVLRLEAELYAPPLVRSALHDCLLASPWVDSRQKPHLQHSPEDRGRWEVEVQVLDVRYAERVEGDLYERIDEWFKSQEKGGHTPSLPPPAS